ncbi:hypothetical protein [Flavobacterium sp. K5-23]|uniref:hypothetical protein n=1 Tax=Flavobacterium sp. K5-23 TaxID=2746225 RepID=UPI00200F1F57|nr:hypothetical protein [Flavobacterium sp. K5-23]UQD55871.1 hypothetical protein FLAK523_05450 [Flavobacterium sp. K5-23]
MNIDKNLILEACLQKQNDLIESFTNRLENMESDAMDHDHSPSQSESRTAGKMELLNAIGKELEFAQREMEFLKNLDPSKVSDVVEPGAVVVTNKMTFYICVSIEKFEVEGNEFFGMSFKAPIYAVMRGLAKGTTFKYNETEYDILDIY